MGLREILQPASYKPPTEREKPMKHLEDLHEDSTRIPLHAHTTLENIKNHALALNTSDGTPIEDAYTDEYEKRVSIILSSESEDIIDAYLIPTETGNILTLEGAEREDGSRLYDDEFTEITEHMEKLCK
jgi:hypothetical protein